MSLRTRLYPWLIQPPRDRRRIVRALIRKARWARDHGDVYGAYMLRLRIVQERAR